MAVFSSKKRGLWLFIGAVFIFGLIGLSGWLFWKYQTVLQKLERLQDPTQSSEVEVESLIQAVGELIILPQEIPTIATITDKSKLENQPFFVRAENGDKVLIYTTAQRAYLYRPSTNKLIDVASFNLTESVEAE